MIPPPKSKPLNDLFGAGFGVVLGVDECGGPVGLVFFVVGFVVVLVVGLVCAVVLVVGLVCTVVLVVGLV